MIDPARAAAIDRWAQYMKDNPDKWKRIHTEFINAQFQKHEAFLKRLREQPGGREKIIELYGIRNLKGYEDLLR
jgi:hypothetical protein